jgi:hypothetical protein
METVKFTVAHYHEIGESPMVILLDRKKGTFKRQYNTIEELKSDIGGDPMIYFVADKNDNRIPDLHNWSGGNFNFDELLKISLSN